jgi:hypothetical protein
MINHSQMLSCFGGAIDLAPLPQLEQSGMRRDLQTPCSDNGSVPEPHYQRAEIDCHDFYLSFPRNNVRVSEGTLASRVFFNR